MKTLPILSALVVSGLTGPATIQGQRPMNIQYFLSWQDPETHLYDIEVRVRGLTGEAAEFALPAWRPGRYLIQNYAANVQEVRATDEGGRSLTVRKLDKQTWRATRDGAEEIRLKYRYYANTLDAGSSLLNPEEAYFNGSNLFVYLVGHRDVPVQLTIQLPDGWQAATGLPRAGKPGQFRAPDYEFLIDCPTILSPTLTHLQFSHQSLPYHIWIQGEGAYDPDRLIEDVKRIVATQVAMMGSVPYEEFSFIYHLVPHRFSHGVEHRNSTSIVLGPGDQFNDESWYDRFLGVTSHELFHAWNVKQIRPEVFIPYDYSREVYTTLLWVMEGVTSYYGELTLRRAGLWTVDRYFRRLAGEIEELQETPGRHLMSLSEASWDAWLSGYGQGRRTSTISFYNKGELIALLLDLEIRRRTENHKSLDDVMRALWQAHRRTGEGLTEEGFRRTIEEKVGSDFDEFFGRYIQGTTELDYDRYLEVAGLRLQQETETKGWLGIHVESGDGLARIIRVEPGSPAEAAGLKVDDRLVALNDKQTTPGRADNMVEALTPGEEVSIAFLRLGRLWRVPAKVGKRDDLKLRIEQLEEPTAPQREVYETWLGVEWEGGEG